MIGVRGSSVLALRNTKRLMMEYQNKLEIDFRQHEPFQNVTIKKSGIYWLIVAFLIGMAALQTGQDFLHAHLNNYRGYLAESLVFKLYWVLFIPIVSLLIVYSDKIKIRTDVKSRWLLGIVAVVVLSFVHIALTAGLIATVSEFFFDNPFPFRTPFLYFASEHFYLTMFFYAAGIGIVFRSVKETIHTNEGDLSKPPGRPVEFISVQIQNKVIPIATKEIICIQADRPYVRIYTSAGQYLHTSTLKEMHSTLATCGFVRVHRTTIINPRFVEYIKSRSNGDYDITLKEGEVVRMSRNYYRSFREVFD